MLKVLVADDHPLFREAVVLSIRHLDRTDSQVLEAGTLDEVCRLATAMPDLDLLLLDLKMPGMDGLGGLLELRRRFPALPVVIVSATEEPRVIREAIAAGAMAYVPKSLDRASIVRGPACMCSPARSGSPRATPSRCPTTGRSATRMHALTPQQHNILRLIVAGKPNKIIAYDLGIAETTVKAHITVILRKLGVFSRTQAVLAARDYFA